jgi:hypothetical protein
VTSPAEQIPEVTKIRRAYFDGDLLTTMPRPGRKRQLALELIVQHFEPGAQYTEPEVNAILRQVWPQDVAALRRYLVDALLLERDAGKYWRIGGTVDTR